MSKICHVREGKLWLQGASWCGIQGDHSCSPKLYEAMGEITEFQTNPKPSRLAWVIVICF